MYAIRVARRGDEVPLERVEQAAFDLARYGGMLMSRRNFAHHIAGGRNLLLVAADADDAVIGYALGFVKAGSPYVRFASLAVLPDHGGRGAGRLLFEAIEAHARQRGLRGVRLEVRADNRRLLDRYAASGYRVFAEVPEYYPDGMAATRMVKNF